MAKPRFAPNTDTPIFEMGFIKRHSSAHLTIVLQKTTTLSDKHEILCANLSRLKREWLDVATKAMASRDPACVLPLQVNQPARKFSTQ